MNLMSCYTPSDGSLFGSGLRFGIMYMMSAGKSEISKLNKTLDETAKVVQELNSELHRRKSSHMRKVSDSIDGNEVMLRKTSSEVRDTGARISSLPAASDGGECGSSALTEESGQPVPEIEQLEAELELELQKLPRCTLDSRSPEEMRPKVRFFDILGLRHEYMPPISLQYSFLSALDEIIMFPKSYGIIFL